MLTLNIIDFLYYILYNHHELCTEERMKAEYTDRPCVPAQGLIGGSMKIHQLFEELSVFAPNWLNMSNPDADVFSIQYYEPDLVISKNHLYIIKKYSDIASENGNYLYLHNADFPIPGDAAFLSHHNESPQGNASGPLQSDADLRPQTPANIKPMYNLIGIHCKETSETAAILSAISDILLRYNKLSGSLNQLLEIQYENLGLQALVDCAYSVLQNPILIVDSDYKILAASAAPIEKRPDLEEQISFGYVFEENIKAIKSRKLYEKARKNRYPTYDRRPDKPEEGWITCMVYIHDIEVAHIAVSDLNRPFFVSDFAFVDSLSKVISVELQKNNFYKGSESMRHSFFLSDLIENSTPDIHTIARRAKSLNWKFENGMRIMTIFIDHDDHFDKKAALISSQLKHMLPGSRWALYKQSIVFLLNLDSSGVDAFRSHSELYDFLRVNSICAALSRSFHSLTEVRKKYEECLHAYQVGHRTDPQNALYLYTDYICHYIGKVLEKSQSLDDFLHPAISNIRDYDRRHNTALLNTLKEFLMHPDEPGLASQKLFIHKNTYFYRLNRIKELFSLDLASGEERLLLHLSLKFLDLNRE